MYELNECSNNLKPSKLRRSCFSPSCCPIVLVLAAAGRLPRFLELLAAATGQRRLAIVAAAGGAGVGVVGAAVTAVGLLPCQTCKKKKEKRGRRRRGDEKRGEVEREKWRMTGEGGKGGAAWLLLAMAAGRMALLEARRRLLGC